MQFLLRTQVVVGVSIVYKGKEHTYGALAAPSSPSASGMYSNPSCQGLLGSLQTQRNSLLLGLGMVAERPQTCECPCSRHHHLREL